MSYFFFSTDSNIIAHDLTISWQAQRTVAGLRLGAEDYRVRRGPPPEQPDFAPPRVLLGRLQTKLRCDLFISPLPSPPLSPLPYLISPLPPLSPPSSIALVEAFLLTKLV